MHNAWLFPALVAVATAALIVSSRPPAAGASSIRLPFADARAAPIASTTTELLLDLERYDDPDYGFSLAVPVGWTPVVAADHGAGEFDLASLEPGHAVGFESPRERPDDLFSDYLMVEILPGPESGLFETDASRRRRVTIDGRPAWRDELTLAASEEEGIAVDLVVRQASLVGLGYNVALYAIGEPSREAFLDDAFEAMLRTFTLPNAPFEVSLGPLIRRSSAG